MGNRHSAAVEVVPKKRILSLAVGSTFLLGDGVHYPGKIKVVSRKGKELEIELWVPVDPAFCPLCNHSENLSRNCTTGVVICMTTGCGHNFGYTPRLRTTVDVADLVDALTE